MCREITDNPIKPEVEVTVVVEKEIINANIANENEEMIQQQEINV